jgi:hypothetical protein
VLRGSGELVARAQWLAHKIVAEKISKGNWDRMFMPRNV